MKSIFLMIFLLAMFNHMDVMHKSLSSDLDTKNMPNDVIGEQDDDEEEDVDEWMDINCNCCETCNNCCYFTKRIGCKNKNKQSRQSCKNTDLPIYIEKPPTSDLELPKYKFMLNPESQMSKQRMFYVDSEDHTVSH